MLSWQTRRVSENLLRPSEEMLGAATRVLETQRGRLREWGILGELRLVGGSSMPGLQTYGDVDLLVRVPAADFADACDRLRSLYTPRRIDLWSDEMALFSVDASHAVELAAVRLGSAQDRHFVTAWDRLAESPELRDRYNALKLDAGSDYEARKAAFFTEIAGP